MITEAVSKDKKLWLYKELLTSMWEYYLAFPLTQVGQHLEKVIEQGKKVIPSDKKAQEILSFILETNEKPAAKIQHLLNDTFEALPIEVRPLAHSEDVAEKFKVALWCTDNRESDKVWSLLNLEGDGSKGYWSLDGEKTKLERD